MGTQAWIGNLALPPVLARRQKRRVGLLGGSFNPAHDGHLHISRMALRLLGLDEIWWLVSPQNPLKPVHGMASFADRLAHALHIANDPHIRVTGLETGLGSRYTIDTLKRLHRRFPLTQFTWLMGADNLAQIHRWAGWEKIFTTTPIAILDRPGFSLPSLSSKSAHRFARHRLAARQSRSLVRAALPAWIFLPIRLMPVSATDLRTRGLGLPLPSSSFSETL